MRGWCDRLEWQVTFEIWHAGAVKCHRRGEKDGAPDAYSCTVFTISSNVYCIVAQCAVCFAIAYSILHSTPHSDKQTQNVKQVEFKREWQPAETWFASSSEFQIIADYHISCNLIIGLDLSANLHIFGDLQEMPTV